MAMPAAQNDADDDSSALMISSQTSGNFEDSVDDFADADAMDTLPEPPAHPPQLFPGPAQSGLGASFFLTASSSSSLQSKDSESPEVAAARKIAIDEASFNYRCGKPECAELGRTPPPPILLRQNAFSFKEEVMVTCIVCKKKSRIIVLY